MNSYHKNTFKSSQALDTPLNRQTKYNAPDIKLSENDLIEMILSQFNIEVNKGMEIAKKLFKGLDKNKSGYIDSSEFLKEIIDRKTILTPEEHSLFSISKANLTNSVLIIIKLKHLKSKSWLQKDKRSQSSIDYIIKTINEQSLYELERKRIDNQVNNASGNKGEEIAFIIKYSQLEDINQRESDIRIVRRKSKQIQPSNYATPSGFLLAPIRDDYDLMSLTEPNATKSAFNLMFSPSLYSTLSIYMEKLTETDFDIFAIDELLGTTTTVFLAHEILKLFDVVRNGHILKTTLDRFIEMIVSNYSRENAIYHNDLHAGDVMQTVFTIIVQGDVAKKAQLENLEIFCLIISAMCHDFKHPGQNNAFHINSKSSIAQKYNDISVLENYHVAQTFKVLSEKEYDIFEQFQPEEYRICRKRIIEEIIATDMAKHGQVISIMKGFIQNFNIKKGKNFEMITKQANERSLADFFSAQQSIQNMIMHSADISNPAKPDKISQMWTTKVYDEFFRQGDLERKLKLPLSQFCDRHTTRVDQAMIGFIQYVVGPTIDILTNLFPEVSAYQTYCIKNLRKHELRKKKDDEKRMKE